MRRGPVNAETPTLIHERVAQARAGTNPYVICKLPSGWLVIGDVQPLPGYCLLLADPVVESLNALDEAGRVRYSLDVARIGGITPWLKVAHLAETFNVPICPHFLMELHVGLCAAVPNAPWVEYIPQLDSVTQGEGCGMASANGFAIPSAQPGLGIEWDWQAIERLAVRRATVAGR